MCKSITLLTDKRYLANQPNNWYVNNIFKDDELLIDALKSKGFKVFRTNWDNPTYNWNITDLVLFRTTWDYFERFREFSLWLKRVNTCTTVINPVDLIYWNLDKKYLLELNAKGVNIASTVLIKKGNSIGLSKLLEKTGFAKAVFKPSISGAARHTYIITKANVSQYDALFAELIQNEDFLIQEFQNNIQDKGEVSMMYFGGKYSHSVLKTAKKGDFRVQDDFGGTVQNYMPDKSEIEFGEYVLAQINSMPTYARVDIFKDNNTRNALGELELIEPELWFRKHPKSAEMLAKTIANQYL
ncbi:MAG: ATP-grasp domain-containing protein [Bacteroidia bacterium]